MVAPDGVNITLNEQSSHVNCIDGTIAGLPPGWLGSGHPSLGSEVSGTNPSGAFLDSEDAILSFEGQWTLEISPAGNVLLPLSANTPAKITGGTMYVYSIPIGPEPITVTAGSFVTLVVEQDFLYEISVTLPEGTQHQVFINTRMRQYFVERIGPVRVEFAGGTISSSDGSVSGTLEPGGSLELIAYSIP
jgi:hypothetical protein